MIVHVLNNCLPICLYVVIISHDLRVADVFSNVINVVLHIKWSSEIAERSIRVCIQLAVHIITAIIWNDIIIYVLSMSSI